MPKARVTDPATSHEAAKSVQNVTETQAYILRCLKRPADDTQLIARYRAYKSAPYASESGIRSRRSELAGKGLVMVVGETKTPSGRRAQVWKVA